MNSNQIIVANMLLNISSGAAYLFLCETNSYHSKNDKKHTQNERM